MTLSNLVECERYSARSFGTCWEEPYAYDIVLRHMDEVAETERKIAEIQAKCSLLRGQG